MTAPLFRALLPALALVALPLSLAAQDPAAPTAPDTPAAPAAPAEPAAAGPSEEQVQAWVTELQEIGGQLQSIQQEALRDSVLSSHQETLGAEIKAAMDEVSPGLSERMARFEALEAEAAAAQQSGDTAKLQGLAEEAQQIQQEYSTAQEQVLQQPVFTEKVNAFQTHLETKMGEVNPGAPQLIARFRELENQVVTALYGPRPS